MEMLSKVLKSLTMSDENTVVVEYGDAVKVKLEDIKDLMQKLYEFTGNRPMKRLIIITRNSSMDMEARKFLQEQNKERRSSIIAEAVLVTSLTQKMGFNFYLKFVKDSFPTKFFTDREKAEEWLRQQS